jgi:hypothetical protein
MEVTFEWIMNKINKDKVYKSFSENFNKILKSKGLVNINAYPTTYGIGIFVFAGTKIPETKKNIENLLNSLGIIYTTEYSDANLVFRYKISKSKENIEKIEQIENKKQTGGMMEGQPPANFENVLYTQLANRYEKGGLIAPNGKKSNLTAEQYKLVRTPEFKAWFGDWENDAENSSKVIDENGEPLVVYRTDESVINKYKKRKEGIFFQSKKEIVLKYYSNLNLFFLNIKSPKEIEGLPNEINAFDIKNTKYDGVINYGVYGGKEIIVINPNQIKLADGTNTTFDGNNPDIRYKDGGTANSELIEQTLNIVYNGKMNSDDAAIQLDESGIEVDEDLYDKLRDAEKTFLNKNKGLQVGDIITVKGKNGNQDFKGNFRGFTNDGKLIVVYEGGNQMMIGKDDYYKNGGELKKGIKSEKEHIDTAKKLYNREITPNQAARSIAMEHLKEDPKYYSKMETIDFDKHYDEIKTKYAGGGSVEPTYTLNTPSGDKSRLTYLQQVLVRTTAFKNFFGDWETAAKNYLADNKENFKEHFKNVSKVMDMSVLEPRAVFHGTKTGEEFFMFDVTKQKGVGRPYAYFAHNKQYSENFTDFSNRAQYSGKPFLYECFLNIRNPFRAEGDRYETKTKDYEYWLNTIIGTIAWDKYSTIEKNSKTKNLEEAVNSQIEKYLSDKANGQDIPFWNYMARDTKSEFKYFLISYGYDGIFYSEEYSSVYDVNNPKQYTKAVCVFTANDIKLANGKNLNFDPMTADIRYEEGGVPNPNVNGLTEHNMTAKDKLGSLLFGDKYAKGGTTKYEEEIIPMQQDQSSNNRKFVDELIKKMKK